MEPAVPYESEFPSRPRGKRILEAMLLLASWPRVTAYGLLRRCIGRERAFAWLSESVAQWAGPLGVLRRATVYRQALDHVGSDVYIGFGTLLSKPAARLGQRAYIGRYCTVGWVDIEADVRIADHVQLLSGAHHHAAESNSITVRSIAIGRAAWIGAGAIVMADVGEGAVVGAGSVVTRPVLPNTTVVGAPARPVVSLHRQAG